MPDEILEGGDLNSFPGVVDDSQPSEGDVSLEESDVLEEKSDENEDNASEGVKTPSEEESSPQPIKEEKTVPYERFKKVNDELARFKSQKGKKPISENLSALKMTKKLVSEFSEEELDSLADIANSDKPEDLLRIADNPIIKMALEAKRKKVADEHKVPAPSSFGGVPGISYDNLRNMPEDDFKKLIEKESQTKRRVGI